MKSIKNRIICSAAALAICVSASVPALADDSYTVNASAGNGGSISPNYNVTSTYGDDLTFKITPDEGYKISKIIVDGKEIEDAEDRESYIFYNLDADHFIRVEFKKITKSASSTSESTGYTKVVGHAAEAVEEDTTPWQTNPDTTALRNEANKDKTFYIKAESGTGGTISPNNTVSAKGGENVTFTITPKSGYVIKTVYIDGVKCGSISSYTFSNLAKDHTIRAEFQSEASASLAENVSGSAVNKIETTAIKFDVSGIENPFRDVDSSNTYYKSILNVYDNDVIVGTSANEFSPSEYFTRQEAARALYRTERIVSSGFSNPYSDVSASSSYKAPIAWSYHMNIIDEKSNGIFNPEGTVTKEELCQMIYNYAKYTGAAPTGSWAINLTYTDMNQLSVDKSEAVMYCTLKQIVSKNSNGTLEPKKVLTRAEAADILNRAMIVTRRDSGKVQ